ncbi:hypothetical protein [Marinobacter sp. ELB17]|uniref:hypothetical protein n=1 Tax=Marinobacter sp. ELB17 TaxID=270374 RepID=UPI0000F37565|nr:hypothetical protein [Marinobacter sp. ELB17]EBA00632.1 hypothetical protein MELB17_22385 [Marinobacter sp. ELB17]
MPDLDTNIRDRLVSVAKGVSGACPLIGPIISEAIGQLIPDQRLDRVISFLKTLEEDFAQVQSRLSRIERNSATPEGLDILEEGMLQAARSVSKDRQKWLAAIVGRSLSSESLRYNESRKLLNLYRELTDPELIWLIYISESQGYASPYHKELADQYPDILNPASRSYGVSQEEADRSALQDGYKNTLLRLGLATLKQNGPTLEISPLGQLLVRYISDGGAESES